MIAVGFAYDRDMEDMVAQVNPFNNKPTSSKTQATNTQAAWDEVMRADRSTGLTKADYGDPEKGIRRSRMIGLVVTVLVVICLAAASFFYLKHAVDVRQEMLANSSSVSSKAPAQDKVKEEEDTTKKSGDIVNPVADSDAVGDAVQGNVTATASKNTVSIKAGGRENLLTMPALTADVKATTEQCVLREVAANCYLGESEVSGKKVMLWAYRDAKTSALLSSELDAKTTTPNGSAVSFIRQVSYNGKNLTGLFIVEPDQTGWLVASEDQATITAIASGDSKFQVTNSD